MTDFNNFWYVEAWGNLASNDYKFARLPLELSLHYLVKRKNRVFKHIEASIWNVWRCNLQNFGLQILIPSRAVRTTSEQANWFYLLHRWKSLHCCSTDERSKWSRLRTASDKEAWRQLSAFSADPVHIHCWIYRCCLSEWEICNIFVFSWKNSASLFE